VAKKADWHRLSAINPSSLRAFCSRCGETECRRSGEGYVCLNARRDAQQRWRREHPERDATTKGPSPHRLTWKDLTTMTGGCPIDGVVPIVAFARGYTCGVRAAELRSKQQSEPTPRCMECGRFATGYNEVSPTGLCQRCAKDLDWATTQWSREGDVGQLRDRGLSSDAYRLLSEYDLHHPEGYVPDYESAVPGWKTLGAS
jgi:hypothetical protein